MLSGKTFDGHGILWGKLLSTTGMEKNPSGRFSDENSLRSGDLSLVRASERRTHVFFGIGHSYVKTVLRSFVSLKIREIVSRDDGE